MTEHRRHRHSMNAYVDGELDAPRVRLLEEHLAGCNECRLELDNLQKLKGLLHEQLADVPAESAAPLWPGVRSRIEEGRPDRLPWAWIRELWDAGWERPRLSLASASLIAFLFFFAGYLLWTTPVGGPPGGTIPSVPGQGDVVVEAVEPEPGFRAMVLTTSGRHLKVIWVVPRGRM